MKHSELVVQKRFLATQLREVSAVRDSIYVLAQALTGQLDDIFGAPLYVYSLFFSFFLFLFFFFSFFLLIFSFLFTEGMLQAERGKHECVQQPLQ